MSEQTSFVTFKGSMGKLSFYKRKGVHAARSKGGTSKSRIMNDPKMQRVRENISEFGALAQAGKSFRRAITAVNNLKDGTLTNRLTKVFRIINKRSDGIRGQRAISLSQHRALLKDLQLNADQLFISAFAAPFTASHVAARNRATVQAQDIVATEMITAPPTATHFRLVQLLGTVADTVYDEESKKYGPAEEALNGLSKSTFSEYLLLGSVPVTVSLETVLPGEPALTESVSVIQGLGIVFYEKIGTEYYALAQGNAMQLVSVF